jgi:cytochrome c biogenesis protein CcmG, thiol:disulfide interchange protein DsbE
MSRRSRALSICAVAAALASLIVFGLSGAGSKGERQAPALPSARLAGPAVTLAGLRGRSVLVTFWASWCGPCAHEAPALERFSASPAGRARLVGVDWSDGLAGARSFIRSYHWTFPTLRDADGRVGLNYGLTGLPSTFVIDPSGHIRETLRGPQTEQSLTRALASLHGS